MSKDVEKFVRIQEPVEIRGKREKGWRTIPLGDRVRVWEMVMADAVADEVEPGFSNKRYIFHVGYLDHVSRGCLVTYMGSKFSVLSVSDSTRLRGLEMRCAPSPHA